MNIRSYIFYLLIFIVLFSMLLHADSVSAEERLSIDVLPADKLFDISNMKPGDWAPRTTTIKNSGNIEFEYSTSVKSESEDKKLYNELLLEVWDDETELYNGKLSEFTGFSPRTLSPNEEDELEYIVRFPHHLGNDFQGLDAQFTIYYTAEAVDSNESKTEGITGTIDSGGDGSGGVLPKTATNMFSFIVFGALLIAVGGIISLLIQLRLKVRSARKM